MTTTTSTRPRFASDLLEGDRVRIDGEWTAIRYLVTCLADRTQTIITTAGAEHELNLDASVDTL